MSHDVAQYIEFNAFMIYCFPNPIFCACLNWGYHLELYSGSGIYPLPLISIFTLLNKLWAKKKKTATKKGPVLGSWYASLSCGRICLGEMLIGRNVWHAKTIRSRSIIKGPKAFYCDRDLSPFSLSYHSALTRGWWRWSTSRTYFHSWQSALFYLL